MRDRNKIITLTYKCINELASKYLAELITLRIAVRRTISVGDDFILKTSRTKLVTAAIYIASNGFFRLFSRVV